MRLNKKFPVAFLVAAAAVCVLAKDLWATTYELIGKPFDVNQITSLPGLGNHLELKLTFQKPVHAGATNVSSALFTATCGTVIWSNYNAELDKSSVLTFTDPDGLPDGFCDVGIVNNPLNPTQQVLAVTGDTENIVFGDINGGMSGIATVDKNGLSRYALSFDSPYWLVGQQDNPPNNIPLPSSVLLFGSGLVGLGASVGFGRNKRDAEKPVLTGQILGHTSAQKGFLQNRHG